MSEELQPKTTRLVSLNRRIGIYAGVLLVVFLLGFIPMWVKARGCSSSLAETEQRLRLAEMQNNLSAAVIDARRAEYESSRQAASKFFTDLRTQTDTGSESALTQSQRDGVQPLFARQDEIITLLARSDPASADRLADLYLSYRKIMGS